jgi:hypothetical protein
MSPKPTSKSTEYKPLTASDYLLYNQLVLGFHTLQYAATHHFLKGTSDRKKLAALVERQILRTLKALEGDPHCECPPGTCQDRVRMCKPCTGPRFAPDEFDLLILETGQYIDEVGLDKFSKQLSELRNGLPTRPAGR